ncbi:tRNA (N6-isopentenyl adenosine(37)-C2)-methylthiotransferase MiaB [Fibrobacter sp.]|uniref:tRNA (N6-isopentenyl adenosine(37)-C2)-methylthiotransferase MiaB n=1 Tax=Fibrobacter sp. TaxID=35828 RepID=UPI0038904199
MKKYHLATYGCQMNEYDSAMIAEQLELRGCIATDTPENADFIIVNTCSVREKAEDTAIANISKLKHAKELNPNLKIAVCGCMAKNRGEELQKRLKMVDFFVGPDQYRKIPDLFFEDAEKPNSNANGKPIKHHKRPRLFLDEDINENYLGEYAKLQSDFSTFVTIQRGCNKRCSYCIVPYLRGPEKYRDMNDVLTEVQRAADKGVSEVMLLGQTVNAYKTKDADFATLLTKVSEIGGIKRIRFTSPHPRHYTNELIDVLLNNPKVCHYAHIPLQSGSDTMLKKMRRQHNMEQYMTVIEQLRSKDPFYGISTDVICGFVGETADDFEQTMKAFEACQFDTAFMFIYSPRKGTESFKETETLTAEEKLERHTRLVELQNAITLKRNEMMLGRTEELLVEKNSIRDDSELRGRTDNFKKVVFKPEEGRIIKPGDYVKVKLDDIRGWTIRGTLCK